MCFVDVRPGVLVADPNFGTASRVEGGGELPVMWPHGFTARRAGSEVEVLDAEGNVHATTGTFYNLTGARYQGAWLAC